MAEPWGKVCVGWLGVCDRSLGTEGVEVASHPVFAAAEKRLRGAIRHQARRHMPAWRGRTRCARGLAER